MRRVIRCFAAPRLALGVISSMVVYAVIAVVPLPAGLPQPFGEHPFAAAPFLVLVSLLFLSTLSCTWLRGAAVVALWRGIVPDGALELRGASQAEVDGFLSAAGFRGRGAKRWRNRAALGAGWLLHVGLLLLMFGVAVQLAWHDGAAFELAVGETVTLSEPGAVFDRSSGPLAPPRPPQLRIALLTYDPHLHQAGYAPDRSSRLRVEAGHGEAQDVVLDRAKGARVRGTMLYQAAPTGVSLIVELPSRDVRAIHLQMIAERRAAAELTDPAGRLVRVVVDSEHGLDHRRGSGALTIRLLDGDRETVLDVGDVFRFGGTDAKLVDVVRWSGFSYSRSPGLPAVFAGFAVVLVACTLLTVPAGVASVEGDAARAWLNRGGAVAAADWRRYIARAVADRTGVEAAGGDQTSRQGEKES